MSFDSDFTRIVSALQVAQKKGIFNLDEAAAIHGSIINIQNTKLVPDGQQPNTSPDLKNERDQLVTLLDQYKNAIEEFKKQHDQTLQQLKEQVNNNKELKIHITSIERENVDLKSDLEELINTDDDELIEVRHN